MTDYLKYRGKCREMSEELCMTRHCDGFYHCPVWGKEPHWWCVTQDGVILDPSVKDFQPLEMEQYTMECEYCHKTVLEGDAYFVEHHVYECYGHDVGF